MKQEQQQVDISKLLDWIESTVTALPVQQAQIILNFDANVVATEVKTVEEIRHGEGRWERAEIRRFDRLRISRP